MIKILLLAIVATVDAQLAPTSSSCAEIKSNFQSVCPCGQDELFATHSAQARVCHATHRGESSPYDPMTVLIKAVIPHTSELPHLDGLIDDMYYGNGSGAVLFAGSYNHYENYTDPDCPSLCPSMLVHMNVMKAKSAGAFQVLKESFFQSKRLADPSGMGGTMNTSALATISANDISTAFGLARAKGCHTNATTAYVGCLTEADDVEMFTSDGIQFWASMIADGAYMRRNWPHLEETFLIQHQGSMQFIDNTFVQGVVRAQTMLNRYWMGASFPELKMNFLALNSYYDACI